MLRRPVEFAQFPAISGATILAILVGGSALAAVAGTMLLARRRHRAAPIDRAGRAGWRMPPLTLLSRPDLSLGRRVGLTVLRGYLLVAMALVVVRVVQLALTK